MGDVSEISRGLVQRFEIVHFQKKKIGKLSENTLKSKIKKYVSQFTTCLLIQLTTETEVHINGGILLPRSVEILGRLSLSTNVLFISII